MLVGRRAGSDRGTETLAARIRRLFGTGRRCLGLRLRLADLEPGDPPSSSGGSRGCTAITGASACGPIWGAARIGAARPDAGAGARRLLRRHGVPDRRRRRWPKRSEIVWRREMFGGAYRARWCPSLRPAKGRSNAIDLPDRPGPSALCRPAAGGRDGGRRWPMPQGRSARPGPISTTRSPTWPSTASATALSPDCNASRRGRQRRNSRAGVQIRQRFALRAPITAVGAIPASKVAKRPCRAVAKASR